MRIARTAALAVFSLLAVATSARAEVKLTIQDGRVSLAATNATVRQILEEWARVGQTRIINAERVTGAPMTLQLDNMPEAEALAIVLRSVSGYLTAPRPTPLPQASYFDRILVMPTSVPRAASAPPQPAFPGAGANPMFPGAGPNPAFPPPFSEPAADDREIDPVGAAIPNPNGG